MRCSSSVRLRRLLLRTSIIYLNAVATDGDRKQRLEKVVEERRKQYEALLVENGRLREEAEAARHESFDVTEYLRGEILAKDERIADLQTQLDEVNALPGTVTLIHLHGMIHDTTRWKTSGSGWQ